MRGALDSLPYIWRDVDDVILHDRDHCHPWPWSELVMTCGHSREHGRGTPVPDKIRCYPCGKGKQDDAPAAD
jgi:hypothetical protein